MSTLTLSLKSHMIASGAKHSTSGMPHRYSGYFCTHFLGRLPMAGGRVIKRKLNNRACLVRCLPPAAKVGLNSSPSGVVQRQQEGLTMTAISLSNSPIVSEKEGRITTTSRDVAAYFGKLHKNVLQSISNLDCSEEFRVLNFQHTPYIDEQNGQTYSQYEMTKDGFVFLAFSFTGKKAAQLKEAYINRFNEMEEILSYKPQTPANNIFAHVRELIKNYTILGKTVIAHEEDIKKLHGIAERNRYLEEENRHLKEKGKMSIDVLPPPGKYIVVVSKDKGVFVCERLTKDDLLISASKWEKAHSALKEMVPRQQWY